MHEAGYRALGLDWVYFPFHVTDVAAAIAGVRGLGIRGVGVSMPYKLEVMEHLDRIDPLAARIGAVNTVVNDDGVLTGHNTDAEGAARALEELVPLAAGPRVLVLGAGGAARAVVTGLAERGARVTIANRSDEKARELAEKSRAAHLAWGDLQAARLAEVFDAVVNASSAGMAHVAERECPVTERALGQGETEAGSGVVVMDIVYKPIETELLRRAKARGLRTAHGGRMPLHQAAAQFELYTGREAPLEAMEAALTAAMQRA